MKKLFLFLLLFCAFLVRFWHGADFFFWHVDEEIVALTVKRILVDHRLQLIGFPIPGGIYLGPLIYYVIAIFFAISFMNPAVFPLLSALLATLTVYLVYKVGNEIFENRRVGTVAAVLYAFSYLTNVYSHLLTGLTFAPILALLTYWLLYRLVKFQRQKYYFALTFVLTLASQNEGTTLSLIVLSIVCWLFFRFKVRLTTFLIAVATFVAAQAPLLIFDLRHNFFLFKSFLKFFSSAGGGIPHHVSFNATFKMLLILPQTMSRFLALGGNLNIADQILPCQDLVDQRLGAVSYPLVIACLFVLASFVFLSLKKKAAVGNKIVLLHLALIVTGIGLFNLFLPGYFYEWMLVIFFPAISYIFAVFLIQLKFSKGTRIVIVLILLFIFIFGNVRNLFLTSGDFGLKNKTAAVVLALSKIRGQPFRLETLGSCYSQGYVYLFWQQGQLPVQSYADKMFSSTLFLNPNNIKPGKTVVMVNPSTIETKEFYQKYNNYLLRARERLKVGKIEVLITD